MARFKRDPATTPQASELQIAEVVTDGWRCLRLAGEVDMASVPLLLEALSEAQSKHGASGVEVDLREVTFIDSTGVRALISIDELCREAGTPWRIAYASGPVRRVLRIAGILDRLPLEAADVPANGSAL